MKHLIAGTLLIVILLLIAPQYAYSQETDTKPTTPNILELFTPGEIKASGLDKLTPAEKAALNEAIVRLYLSLMTSRTATANVEGEYDLYDSAGSAVAYIALKDELTIYLWTGEPVAYVEDENVYGFNGKHLGWFEKGIIYDHQGNAVAASPENFQKAVKPSSFKSFKKFKPFKSFKQFEPFKPFFKTTWSNTPALFFFAQGAK